MHSNWVVFKTLCRIVGGRDEDTLPDAIAAGMLPQIIAMARHRDLLPAVAMRLDRDPHAKRAASASSVQLLADALQENTRRNMQTVMQALRVARALNIAGITPIFLKGTAQLLTLKRTRLGFRSQLDIDLLVPPAQIVPACQALLDAGYGFSRSQTKSAGQPAVYHDVREALDQSAAHHHLPPMMIAGFADSIELHRHFLPRRFQTHFPLQPLLDSACELEQRGVAFSVPSAEYQVIQMVTGKLAGDGYFARWDFPPREGSDYLDLLDQGPGNLDKTLLQQQCGRHYTCFTQLTRELMAADDPTSAGAANLVRGRLQLMALRYNHSHIATLMDALARARHLGYQLRYSPAKLPAYLRRLVPG